ncbi:MAG: hypothetical protein HOV80_33190 [Polyangiaceae bacterium]|nr:hypothetical protein [Polyangiaceae bacterium]
MRFFGFCFVGLVCALGSLSAACGDDPPDPGFEEVGGSGEGAGGPSTTGPSTTSTKSTGVSSPTTATTSVTGTSTTTNTATSSSTGSGCQDGGPGEPNDTESSAHDLGTIGDCDDEGGSVSGVLDGTTDPDWYKYQGTDGTGCSVDPSREITSSHPIRVCKFIQCDNNEANDFSCPGGTMDVTSPDGRPGCCSTSEFNFGLTCGSSSLNSDNATVYVRIDTTANECVTYTLTYHY